MNTEKYRKFKFFGMLGIACLAHVGQSTVMSDKFKLDDQGRIDITQFAQQEENKAFCSDNWYQGVSPQLLDIYKTSKNNVPLCYTGFNTVYSQSMLMPLYSAEKLTNKRIVDGINGNRSGFEADPTLEKLSGRVVKTQDYTGTGWDRGHLSPSRDFAVQNRMESFYMSNIAPQNPNVNRNVWAKLEEKTRCIAQDYGDTYVVTIPAVNLTKYKETKNLNVIKSKRNLSIVIPDLFIKAIYVPKQKSLYVVASTNEKAPNKINKKDFNSMEDYQEAKIEYDKIVKKQSGNIFTISYKDLIANYGVDPFPFLTENEKMQANQQHIFKVKTSACNSKED